MQSIGGILFEPVGCLAEFPSEPFLELAFQLFGRPKKASQSGNRSYWHLLNLIEAAGRELDESQKRMAEAFEIQAVDSADVYEDVSPALAELTTIGVKLFIASSLSGAAIARFLERNVVNEFFSGVWSRDHAGGVKAAPLRAAIDCTSFKPEQVMFLADTLEGLKVAKSVGVNSILMMNDPDEAKRLALHNPSGGIVSLHELPDFIRLLAANA
jgi:phosphoglycolate phosphatase-like HAD superfamily hydrolase